MVYLDILIGLKSIRKISQNKKGPSAPFYLPLIMSVDLAVVFYVHLSNVQVVEFVVVPYYSPKVSEGRSSTLNTGFSKAEFIYSISRASSSSVSP